jgi:hypothetical protein
MQNIKSATGNVITFNLDGATHLVIDGETGVNVSDQQAEILVDRLGVQLSVTDLSVDAPVAPINEDSADSAAPVEPEPQV